MNHFVRLDLDRTAVMIWERIVGEEGFEMASSGQDMYLLECQRECVEFDEKHIPVARSTIDSFRCLPVLFVHKSTALKRRDNDSDEKFPAASGLGGHYSLHGRLLVQWL